MPGIDVGNFQDIFELWGPRTQHRIPLPFRNNKDVIYPRRISRSGAFYEDIVIRDHFTRIGSYFDGTSWEPKATAPNHKFFTSSNTTFQYTKKWNSWSHSVVITISIGKWSYFTCNSHVDPDDGWTMTRRDTHNFCRASVAYHARWSTHCHGAVVFRHSKSIALNSHQGSSSDTSTSWCHVANSNQIRERDFSTRVLCKTFTIDSYNDLVYSSDWLSSSAFNGSQSSAGYVTRNTSNVDIHLLAYQTEATSCQCNFSTRLSSLRGYWSQKCSGRGRKRKRTIPFRTTWWNIVEGYNNLEKGA